MSAEVEREKAENSSRTIEIAVRVVESFKKILSEDKKEKQPLFFEHKR